MTTRFHHMQELRKQIEKHWADLGDERLPDRENIKEENLYFSVVRAQIEEENRLSLLNNVSYSTNMLAVAYAGYFAIWLITKNTYTPSAQSIVALFGLISLASFVLFEIFRMLNNLTLNRNVMHINDRMFEMRDLQAGFDAVEGAYAKNNRVFRSAWSASFTISVVTGLVGAGTMAYQIFKSLPAIII